MSTPILMKPVMAREDDHIDIIQKSGPTMAINNKLKRQRLGEIKRGVTNWKRVETLAKAHWATYKPNKNDMEVKQRNFILKPLAELAPSKPLKLSSKVLNKIPTGLNDASSNLLRNVSRSTMWHDNDEKTTVLQTDTFSNKFALNSAVYDDVHMKKRIKRMCLDDSGALNETPPDEGLRSKMTSSLYSSYTQPSNYRQTHANKRKDRSKVSCHFQSNNGTVDVIKPIKLNSLANGRRFRDVNERMKFDGDFIQREKTFAMMKRVNGMLDTNPDIVVADSSDQTETEPINEPSTASSDLILSTIYPASHSDFKEFDFIDDTQLPPERQFTFVRTFSQNASFVLFQSYLRELPDVIGPIQKCREWLQKHMDINGESHLILE